VNAALLNASASAAGALDQIALDTDEWNFAARVAACLKPLVDARRQGQNTMVVDGAIPDQKWLEPIEDVLRQVGLLVDS
jgi:hypothetical protein